MPQSTAFNQHKRASGARLNELASGRRQQAIEAAPLLAGFADQLFSRFGVEIGEVNIKSVSRISAKAAKDYGGVVDKVGDTVRLKVTCDSAEQIKLVRQAIWRQKELLVSRAGRDIETHEYPPEPVLTTMKDNFAEPKEHGYRALNAKFRMPNGVSAEIQVVHREMEAANNRTHGTYKQLSELVREVGDGAFSAEQARRYQGLVTRISRIYDDIAERHNLDSLTTMVARSLATDRRQRLKMAVAVAEAGDSSVRIRQDHLSFDRPELAQPGWPGNSLSGHNLDRHIDRLIETRMELLDAGPAASPVRAALFSSEVNDLARNWDQLPEAARHRLTEAGLAPIGNRAVRDAGGAVPRTAQDRTPSP